MNQRADQVFVLREKYYLTIYLGEISTEQPERISISRPPERGLRQRCLPIRRKKLSAGFPCASVGPRTRLGIESELKASKVLAGGTRPEPEVKIEIG